MKLVVLVDGSNGNFEEIAEIVKDKSVFLIDTEHCDEVHEYKYLFNSINSFAQSHNEVMLAKFSGKESIIKNLGDESPEMIVPLSYNKNNRYYTECPKKMFLDLVTIFEKETI